MSTKPLQLALEVIRQAATPDNWAASAAAHGLMIGYAHRWDAEQSRIELQQCEQVYDGQLFNPDTRRPSRTWTITGVMDKIGHEGRDTILYDHKTTSSDISDPSGPYWRQLAVASQASHYELLALQHGVRLDQIIWDVCRKPTIKPKQIAQAEVKRIREFGEYCGFSLDEAAVARAVDTGREDAELFSLRVASECIANPDRYYARRGIPRTREQLLEYARELWQIGRQMCDDRRNGTAFKNSAACFSYGTPCEYLPLCAGDDLETSDRWQKRTSKPGSPGGKNVLSDSRIKCWMQCKRKHYFRYELSIERVDRERSEALDFGSLFHKALDAWWLEHDRIRRSGSCADTADARQVCVG